MFLNTRALEVVAFKYSNKLDLCFMVLPEDIEDLIIDWLTGEISPEGENQLQEWVKTDHKHRDLYVQYCSVWYGTRIGEEKRTGMDEKWLTITRKHQKRRQKFILHWVASVAACCILFFGGYWVYSRLDRAERIRPMTVSELLQNRETGKVKLVLSTGREVVLGKVMTEQEKGSSIYSDSLGLEYSPSNVDSNDEMAYNELIVPKCGEYRLRLADGTQIMVNSESVVRYPVRFSENVREIWLSGEAYFEVARDETKPFIVHLDYATVKVLGTSFNVMAYRDEVNTEVTLVQGSVEVGVAERHEILLPGNQIRVEHATLQMDNRKVDVEQYIAWKDGVLRFDDLSLGKLMNRLSRWYDISFEFRDEELKERLFSGGFKKYEQLERILEMIQEINDVYFRVVDKKILIEKK